MKIDFNINVRLYQWGELYYEAFENNIGIDALIILNSNQEKTFNQLKAKFQKELNEDQNLQLLDSNAVGSYYRHKYEIEEITLDKLKRQQRYSILLSTFSFFEGRLKSICLIIEKRFDFKIKVSDLNRDNNLMRYWNYLIKVYELNFKKIEKSFITIQQQMKVRNIIAHQEGFLKPEEKKYIAAEKGFTLKEVGENIQIEIYNSEYFTFLIENIKIFFKELILAIDDRFTELKSN